MLIDKNTKQVMLGNIEIKRIMSEGGVLWERPPKDFYFKITRDKLLDNYYYNTNGGLKLNKHESFFCLKPVLLPENINYDNLLISFKYETVGDLIRFISTDFKEKIYIKDYKLNDINYIAEVKNKLKLKPGWYIYNDWAKTQTSIQNVLNQEIELSIKGK